MLNKDFRNGSPILVTLVSFWHFAVIRQQTLTPSIAFTSVSLISSHFRHLTDPYPRLLVGRLALFARLRDEAHIPQYLTK